MGNPPWDKVKIDDDEFFSQYDVRVKDLKPNTVKKTYVNKLLESNPEIRKHYDAYVNHVNLKRMFYRNRKYKLQNKGDSDLWKLVFERTFCIITDGGCISMLIPQQLFGAAGLKPMREKVLNMNVKQMYVYENEGKKFFPIHPEYRFILLTLKNESGPDDFDVGFYLHDTTSLDGISEVQKFATKSKKRIFRTSPNDLAITEIDDKGDKLLEKLSRHNPFGSGLSDGWDVGLSSGFHKSADAKLFKRTGSGWPVLEGKNTYQFDYNVSKPEFITERSAGLKRENKRAVYAKHAKEFHNAYRLTFHDVTSPKTTRSIIASLIPPQTFNTSKLIVIVLKNNGRPVFGPIYDRKNAYLLGILNSMTFDFIARPRLRLDAAPMIKNLPIPCGVFEDEISKLAAQLSVGHESFKDFALSLEIENIALSPKKRIHALAELDAMVAYAYGVNKIEYQMIIESFEFGDDPELLNSKTLNLNDKHIRKNFYGEVRKLAMRYFEKIVGMRT